MTKQKKQSKAKEVTAEGKASVVPLYAKDKFIFLLLFLFACLLYLNTVHHDYALDDGVAISNNAYTLQGFKGIPKLLTTDLFSGISDNSRSVEGGRYRPLSLISFAIEYQLFGLNPHVSHFVNMFLYAFLAVVLFIMLRTMFPGKQTMALIATLLFVAHPIHTEAVANIKGRDELFSFLGLVLTMFFLFKYVQSNKPLYFIYSLLTYFLSLLSKEMGVTFLAIIPLSLFLFSPLSYKRIAYLTLSFLIVFGCYFFMRFLFTSHVKELIETNIGTPPIQESEAIQLATDMLVLGKYLCLLFFPHPLSYDYSYNAIRSVSWSGPYSLISLFIYLSLFCYAFQLIIKHLRKDRTHLNNEAPKDSSVIAFSILLFTIPILLVSNVFFNIGTPIGERFLFLPSLGFCIGLSVLFLKTSAIKNNSMSRQVTPVTFALIVVLILFSVKTISRNADWKNNLALFSADVKHAPVSAKAHFDYSIELYKKALAEEDTLLKQSMLDTAKQHCISATAINPNYYLSHYYTGLIYKELGFIDSAIYYLRNTLTLKPSFGDANSVLGEVYGKMKGQYDSAIFYLGIAIKLNDKDAVSFANLGVAYAMNKDNVNAIANIERAAELDPENTQYLSNLSVLYKDMGDTLKAKMYLDRTLSVEKVVKKD